MGRLYHVVKRSLTNGSLYNFVGVFTNRKPLLEALETLGIDGCYIKGARKDKPLNKGSLGTGFERKTCNIYKKIDDFEEEIIEYRIIEIIPNKINPEFNQNFDEYGENLNNEEY